MHIECRYATYYIDTRHDCIWDPREIERRPTVGFNLVSLVSQDGVRNLYSLSKSNHNLQSTR